MFSVFFLKVVVGSLSDFYNWNRVKVRYCDGSSFTGDVQAVNPVSIYKENYLTGFVKGRVFLFLIR